MRVQGIAVAGDVTGLPGVELRLDEPGSAIRRQSLTSLDLRSTYIVTLMTPCAMQPSLSSPSVYHTNYLYMSIRRPKPAKFSVSREREMLYVTCKPAKRGIFQNTSLAHLCQILQKFVVPFAYRYSGVHALMKYSWLDRGEKQKFLKFVYRVS